MSRGHMPYGYQIENGSVIVNEDQAARIRKIYKGYLGGLSLRGAAREAGLTLSHASVKRMMQNPHYLGDEFYPMIIDRETYDAFEAERRRREKALGRDNMVRKTVETGPAPTAYRTRQAEQIFSNPYRQAEYLYSLIESEV